MLHDIITKFNDNEFDNFFHALKPLQQIKLTILSKNLCNKEETPAFFYKLFELLTEENPYLQDALFDVIKSIEDKDIQIKSLVKVIRMCNEEQKDKILKKVLKTKNLELKTQSIVSVFTAYDPKSQQSLINSIKDTKDLDIQFQTIKDIYKHCSLEQKEDLLESAIIANYNVNKGDRLAFTKDIVELIGLNPEDAHTIANIYRSIKVFDKGQDGIFNIQDNNEKVLLSNPLWTQVILPELVETLRAKEKITFVGYTQETKAPLSQTMQI